MKLILNRTQQKKGLVSSKMAFTLEIKADLTAEESENLKRYGLSKEVLYSNATDDKSALGILKNYASATVITVSNLVQGRSLECKDFLEIMALEQQVVEACRTLKEILEAMANFEGQDIIEI